MKLDILLPFRIFAQLSDVLSIVAETRDGAFGLLPQRLDCVAALCPGILSFKTAAEGERFIALDEGVLVKTGADVRVSVRRAMFGQDLAQLRTTVERDFLTQDEQARSLRQVMDKLESGFLARYVRLKNG